MGSARSPAPDIHADKKRWRRWINSMGDVFSLQNLLVFGLYTVVAWIIGHQSTHIASLKAGQATLNYPLAFVMGLETFLGLLFLVWFGYRIDAHLES